MQIQQPSLTNTPFRKVSILGGLFEFLIVRKYFINYFIQAVKRTLRLSNDRYNHFIMYDKLDLGDFTYDESKQKPRGKEMEGKYFSYGYQLDLNEIPASVKDYIIKIKPVIELYFGTSVRVTRPNLWKNFHIPEKYFGNDVFSECFHQDLVVDQFNMQLFVLLHDTDETQGPFEYLDHQIQQSDMDYYKKRNRIVPKSRSNRLTGKRGDCMLFSTGSTLHRAGNPIEGKSRNIMSIAFFPEYSGMPGESLENLR